MVWIGDKEYTHQEYMEKKEREWAEKRAHYEAEARAAEADRQESRRLIQQLGAAYTAYNNFIEARPHLHQPSSGNQTFHAPGDPPSENAEDTSAVGDEAKDRLFYELLRRNLGHADDAPRCTHIKPDGIRCGSPRMKTGMLCYAHQRMLESRPRKLRLPPMDDPNSIQIGLMEVARALIDGQINEKTAGLLLYGLQIAAGNVDRLTFHQKPRTMVVEEMIQPPLFPAAQSQPGVREDPASIYAQMDDDLKHELQQISDEFDRRCVEGNRAARRCTETGGGATGQETDDAPAAPSNTEPAILPQPLGPRSDGS
jgi:hypothetical protein